MADDESKQRLPAPRRLENSASDPATSKQINVVRSVSRLCKPLVKIALR